MNKLFLAEERSRLGLKAKDVADYAGVAIPTQSNYEQGKRFPDAQYLMKIAELGFDINYVITGIRDSLLLSTQEKLLIELFRQSTDSVRRHILSGLLSETIEPADSKTVKGNVVTVGNDNFGNVVGGDVKPK